MELEFHFESRPTPPRVHAARLHRVAPACVAPPTIVSEESGNGETPMNGHGPSLNSRLYVWRAQHRGHAVERDVVYVIDDDALSRPPASEITLRCIDCGESLLLDLSR